MKRTICTPSLVHLVDTKKNMKSRYEKNVPFVHLVFVARGGAEQGRGLRSGRAGGCRAGQGRAGQGQGRTWHGRAGQALGL